MGILLTAPQAQAQDSTTKELKILSWNIKMLPFSFIKKRNHHTRARKIAKELNKREYDIIVFQEAFRSSSRKVLKKKLRKKYQKEKVPQFICGDMNTAQSDSLYQEMLHTLQSEDIQLSKNSDVDFTAYNTKKQQKVIDYVLLKKNKLKLSKLASSIRMIGEKWDLKNAVMADTHGGLSEHLAVELIAEF